MAKLSKRMKAIVAKIVPGKIYSITEAVNVLKSCGTAKFKEGVDISVRLGVDPRKSDQVVRGACDLPHGNGRTVRIAVFAQGANAEAAKAAGADIVGFEDLAESIKGGQMDFDLVIASPDAMRLVGQLGQVLGPRGLMPNPKVGTVTPDVAGAVRRAKAGQARFRVDKAGIIHCSVGKIDFEVEQLKENLEAVLTELKKLKPGSSKGIYLRKLSMSTTMGPGVLVDLSSLAI